MKIAIHHRKGSFSDRWIVYCEKNNIPYIIVNCYDTDIVQQLKGCDALMWHHNHQDYKDVLFAKQLLFSLEQSGLKVFPDLSTGYHFDDKVGQKYLLEAIGAPLVSSSVFYDKKSATEWANNTIYPKVFKLRGGAGAMNVSLIRTKGEALKKINRAFGRGFSQFNRWGYFKERLNKYLAGKDTLFGVIKGIARIFITTEFAKMQVREKGYVYFQEFIPNNDSDIRVIVIGEKAYGIKRMVRKNDFRASGSGEIKYDSNEIDKRCIKTAFQINNILKSQSVAYDFVFDLNQKPLIVEISYGFSISAYDFCPGYWDSNLEWHEGRFNPQEWMVQNLIQTINENN